MIPLFSLGVLACGAARKPAGASSAASSSSPAASTASSATPTNGGVFGDYDNDDYESNQSDGDNDDSHQPKDRDNDFDNHSGSYYDKDDNGVRNFGHTASSIDRRKIVALVERYYAAAKAQDGAPACSLLTSTMAKAVPEDLGRPPGPSYYRGNTCPEVMTKVFRQNAQQLRAYATMLQVTGVRVVHDEGLAVLAFNRFPARTILVGREHGTWKIAVVLDRELP